MQRSRGDDRDFILIVRLQRVVGIGQRLEEIRLRKVVGQVREWICFQSPDVREVHTEDAACDDSEDDSRLPRHGC